MTKWRIFKWSKTIITGLGVFLIIVVIFASFYSIDKTSWIVYSSDSENLVLDNISKTNSEGEASFSFQSDKLNINNGFKKITNVTPVIILKDGNEIILQKGELQIISKGNNFEFPLNDNLTVQNVGNPKFIEIKQNEDNKSHNINFRNWSNNTKLEFSNNNQQFVLYFYKYNHENIIINNEELDDMGLAIYPLNNFQHTLNGEPIEPIILNFEGSDNTTISGNLSNTFSFNHESKDAHMSFSNTPFVKSDLTMFTIEEQVKYELPKTNLSGSGKLNIDVLINDGFKVDIVGEVNELKAANRSLLPSLIKFLNKNLETILVTLFSAILAAYFSFLNEKKSVESTKE
ncbi:hypothetical protein [Oceanobacillus salinisoli]|uniref:hypothetical protein n=1 Tax=Oceanobacillus salinisoli TaxID=2678611 RepID=UPI0012E26CAD|nr:hypothetical protein [Oceanobacillus salinisoli]